MPSRAGDVLTAPTPITVILDNPTERVLFCSGRDANPFFHFFECLWLMAGRDDAAFLNRFVRDFGQRFSDDGVTLHGSYGYRWRKQFGIDQICQVIQMLKIDPFTRRAMLVMWDPAVDLAVISKDLPCNVAIKFRVMYGKRDEPNRLNMTVFQRSGDVIWGVLGANAVHMSFLLEYIAAHLGLVVGTMTTVVDDFHAYRNIYDKIYHNITNSFDYNPYDEVKPHPIVQFPESWDEDLTRFLEDPTSNTRNQFFYNVAKPLWFSHLMYKEGNTPAAIQILDKCKATDWRKAGQEWLIRRKK